MIGEYGKDGKPMPRVLHISIARFRKNLPKRGEPQEFLVSLHEEGTGITWQQNVTIDLDTEQDLLRSIDDVYRWNEDAALAQKVAHERIGHIGKRMYETFIGHQGECFLTRITPTAILLNVDETILNLPWELINPLNQPISQRTPFGRLVTTRIIPKPARNPLIEDRVVRILAVGNPTSDLTSAEREIVNLQELDGLVVRHSNYTIKVDVLARERATRANFFEKVSSGEYDILHFSGHGEFDESSPGTSGLSFADGILSANDILKINWKQPPYFVFNSACETARNAGGKRLISRVGNTIGLAGSFLASGVEGYAGYFWPVRDVGAGLFAKKFYSSLVALGNIGLAFLEARKDAEPRVNEAGDITGFSAVLFGDAGSKHRLDLMSRA